MPLYGRQPYYSPDDVTEELFITRELPVFQSFHNRLENFFRKWRLWILGIAMLALAATAVLTAVVGAHKCCSVSNFQEPAVPQFPAVPPKERTTTRDAGPDRVLPTLQGRRPGGEPTTP